MLRSLVLIIVSAALAYGVPTGRNVVPNAIASLNNLVGKDILDKLSSEEGNIFFSPLSISTILSTLYLGARGESQQELGTLGYYLLENDNIDVPASYQKLLRTLQTASDEYKLEIANALLTQADYHILDEYKNTLKTYYNALVKEVDFFRDNQRAVQEVNKWVSQKTHGKISNLIDDLDVSTRLVLLNAVYFKGTWQTKFDPEMTRQLPFYNNGQDDSSKSVPTMKINSRFPYVDYYDKQLKAIQLPYKGKDISMLVVLPYERDGLDRLQKEMSHDTINDIIKHTDETRVILSLPKFKLEYFRNLNEDLKSRGIKNVFGPDADLSGINGKNDLYVSDIVHKAVIEVNEEGSEAAAVTGIVSNRMRPILPMINEFDADHPFLFYIIDNRTNTHLFVGRVSSL